MARDNIKTSETVSFILNGKPIQEETNLLVEVPETPVPTPDSTVQVLTENTQP